MTASHVFEPDWMSAPGHTIADLMQERNLQVREFASATHRTSQEIARLLSGTERLTPEWAEQLSQTLGASPQFWMRREERYLKELERLCRHSDADPAVGWLNELPIRDMVRFRWIEEGKSKAETLMNALMFFGVHSIDCWRRTYREALSAAAYRTSTAFEIKPGAAAAWLRQGEILAREVDCAPWDAAALQEMLPKIRELSREPDPTKFLPELVALCCACGIAVVAAPLPDGGRASGATKFLSANKALMLLSFRYLSDDQFWFTVFHEVGHLLLHSGRLFLEGIETGDTQAEDEADSFAAANLFTEFGLKELEVLPLNHFAIARFAKKVGVSPGLVVGQLQTMRRVSHRHFNYLKKRYKWMDAALG